MSATRRDKLQTVLKSTYFDGAFCLGSVRVK